MRDIKNRRENLLKTTSINWYQTPRDISMGKFHYFSQQSDSYHLPNQAFPNKMAASAMVSRREALITIVLYLTVRRNISRRASPRAPAYTQYTPLALE